MSKSLSKKYSSLAISLMVVSFSIFYAIQVMKSRIPPQSIKINLMAILQFVFRSLLQQFASTHAKDIRSNPTFRAEFARMCSAIGVEPAE